MLFFTSAGLANRLEVALHARVHRARELAGRGDRGASAVEWVIITAVLVTIVIAVGTLLYNKINTAAGQIDVNPSKVGGGGGGGGP